MINTTIGILAHVDAGKTTLAEAVLFTSGAIRNAGRVDSGNTALDTHELEKERGITIFPGLAEFNYKGREFSLIDTPGHVDFSSSVENTLAVLDYAILVISGAEGVQSHTRTLWQLLALYNIPTFIFVTKMDYSYRTKNEILSELIHEFGDGITELNNKSAELNEHLAMFREDILEKYLSGTAPDKEDIISLIRQRFVFPVNFGSGLKMTGIDSFLSELSEYTVPSSYTNELSARVFRVSFDDRGNRITYLKVTGGTLNVRDTLYYDGNEEKISSMKKYTGNKCIAVDGAFSGDVCTVTGISALCPGDGIGKEKKTKQILEPVLISSIILPDGIQPETVIPKLKQLEAEDPSLTITWIAHLKEIRISLKGKVQAEILKSIISDRFGIDIDIGPCKILYKETVKNTVEGIGHYEPLRHYAEVHLLIEPGEKGSGITVSTKVSEDVLDRNWQRLIVGHITEKQHIGVLTGSILTDVKITLVSGKAHTKHTEGGDFRQATYRAIRQGLMTAESELLEPWYSFILEVPPEYTGRAISDIKMMHGEFGSPETKPPFTVLKGRVPVATSSEYSQELASYTSGTGRFSCIYDGYYSCHNADEVISTACYNPEADLSNTPDSVFCAHGSGFNVKWNEVKQYMHLPSVFDIKPTDYSSGHRNFKIDDRELEEIMKREFGSVKYELYKPMPVKTGKEPDTVTLADSKQHIIVDGYNVIFAWDDLNELAGFSLESARDKLAEILCNYAAYTKYNVILVFDAYKVAGNRGEKFNYKNIHIVYTKENELGDIYIEKLISEIGKNDKVRVVTSDGLIQLSAVRKGILRTSAKEFEAEIDGVINEIRNFIDGKK